MSRELRSWEGTPYVEGARVRGHGCICVGFMSGALDALCGVERPFDALPADVAFHAPATAWTAVRALRDAYQPNVPALVDELLEPGDVVVVFQGESGPCHVMLADVDQLWHAPGPGGRVERTGLTLDDRGFVARIAYRYTRKHEWAS